MAMVNALKFPIIPDFIQLCQRSARIILSKPYPGEIHFLKRALQYFFTILILYGVTGLFFVFLFQSLRISYKSIGFVSLMVSTGILIFGIKQIREKQWYANGKDDALVHSCIGSICFSIVWILSENLNFPLKPWFDALLCSVILSGAGFLFVDAALICLGWAGFILSVFLFCESFGLSVWLPPLCFVLGTLTYLGCQRIPTDPRRGLLFLPWFLSFRILEFLGLILLYTSINYYVVRELGRSLLHPGPTQVWPPFPTLFWIATFFIPLAMLAAGLTKKNKTLLHSSLLCLSLSFLTFKYYYQIAPIEQVLSLSGVLLLVFGAICWFGLKKSRWGLSREPDKDPSASLIEEALAIHSSAIVSQASHHGSSGAEIPFKGNDGQFGGGGATGKF